MIIHLCGWVRQVSSNLRRLLSTIRYFSISNYFSQLINFANLKNLFIAIFNKINNYWDLIIWPKIISNVANIRLLLEDINNLNNFIMFVFQKEGLNMFNPKIVAPIFFQYWFL